MEVVFLHPTRGHPCETQNPIDCDNETGTFRLRQLTKKFKNEQLGKTENSTGLTEDILTNDTIQTTTRLLLLERLSRTLGESK